MRLARDTPYEVGWITWPRAPTEPVLTVLVKATFALGEDGCRALDEQPPIAGDAHHDEDPDRSLRGAAELVPFKPCGELFVAGTCYPPSGAAAVSAIEVRVGALRKSLAVFGDRDWTLLGGAGKPETFVRMPLAWERAFGGPGYGPNPFGRGLEPVETDRGPRRSMPNLELPDRLITGRGDRPTPAGMFPLLANHPQRAGAAAGSASAARARWPAYPEGFDFRRCCAAPIDQRIEGYWRGDEEIVLTNLRPDRAILTARLPGSRPRVLLERRAATTELVLRLDTIAIDGDAATVSCLWRGIATVRDLHASDVVRVLVTDEARSSSRSVAECVAAIDAHERALARGDEHDFEPPSSSPSSVEPVGRTDAPQPIAPEPIVPKPTAPEPWTRESLVALLAVRRDTDLSSANLRGLDLTGLDLRGALLDGADLSDAKLDGAKLDGAEMTGAVLSRVSARKASFRDTTLDGAKLDGAVLDDADLTNVRASDGADLTGASLARANASSAHFDEATLDGANLSGAQLSRADFRRARLDGASLVACTMRRALLSGCVARRADLRGCDLLDAQLDGADLTDADLRGASLFAAHLPSVRLDGAKLDGADLGRTVLAGSR